MSISGDGPAKYSVTRRAPLAHSMHQCRIRCAFSASAFFMLAVTQSILSTTGLGGHGHKSSFGHDRGLNASTSKTIGRVSVSKHMGISLAFSLRSVLVWPRWSNSWRVGEVGAYVGLCESESESESEVYEPARGCQKMVEV